MSNNPETFTMCLGYTTPFDFTKIISFFKVRALSGVEIVRDGTYARCVSHKPAGKNSEPYEGWFLVQDDPKTSTLNVEASNTLEPIKDFISARISAMFDLNSEVDEVFAAIEPLNGLIEGAAVLGVRVPGCFDPFETACRAILGQQISVSAANKLAARIVEAVGHPVELTACSFPELTRTFPAAAEIAEIENVEETFGQLGVIKTRSRCIGEIARLIVEGELDLSGGEDAEKVIEQLQAIKGIGPWTANYIAMRALSHTDAFLETDVGVKHALPDLTPKQRLAAAENWRPYRSYANISLWNSLG